MVHEEQGRSFSLQSRWNQEAMKTFKQYIFSIPDYPVQLPPEKDDGEWALGDPARPIEGWETGDAKTVLSKASKQIEKDRNKK